MAIPGSNQRRLRRTVVRTSVIEYAIINLWWTDNQAEKAAQLNHPGNMETLYNALRDVIQTRDLRTVNSLLGELKDAFERPQEYCENLQVSCPLHNVKDAIIRVLNSLLSQPLSSNAFYKQLVVDALMLVHQEVKGIIEGCVQIQVSTDNMEKLESLIKEFHEERLHKSLHVVLKYCIIEAINKLTEYVKLAEDKLEFKHLFEFALDFLCFEVSLPVIDVEKKERVVAGELVSLTVEIVDKLTQPKDFEKKKENSEGK